jgi:hypothetical protein
MPEENFRCQRCGSNRFVSISLDPERDEELTPVAALLDAFEADIAARAAAGAFEPERCPHRVPAGGWCSACDMYDEPATASRHEGGRADGVEALAFIRALVNAWDCCGTCAGGVLAKRDRERDAQRDAAAEQRGREDNADHHGMCYVHGSESLAARLADAKAEALREAADEVQDECRRSSSSPCFCGSADWLRDRASRIDGEGS